MATRQRIGTTRRGFLVRGGALVVSASGLGALAPAALAATSPPAGDLAYLRLLIAAELLAIDFYGQALSDSGGAYGAVARKIRADDREHYSLLANLMTAAGQTPATADDIDFSYPKATFASRTSALHFATKLEEMIVGSYIDAAGNVQTADYRQTMAQILVHEAQHHSALARLKGQSLIGEAFPAPVSMSDMSDFLDQYES